jgi:hypothetical protein
MKSSLETEGFTLIPRVLTPSEIQHWITTLGPVTSAGRRGLLSHPAVAKFARSTHILDLLRPHLPADPIPVRAIYFDKSPESNWLVAWHQDLTIAVQEKHEVPDFGPWSIKDGIPHVQPPVECLAQMLTLRLHLDDADETNGALRVLPRTHKLGRLSTSQILQQRDHTPEHLCTCKAGDALLMRPLLLHASSRATIPSHRRILHIEYAAFDLPSTLQWNEGAHH